MKKKSRRRSPWKRALGVLGYAGLLAVACGAGVVANMAHRSSMVGAIFDPRTYFNMSPQKTFGKEDGLNLLILGTDDDRVMTGWAVDARGRQHAVSKVSRRGARADMILVAHLDFQNNAITGLSIPRDTGIRMPDLDRRILKINGYYSVAPKGEGKEYMRQAVEALLPGVRIDRTIALDYDGFKRLVDIIGGVPVVVPKGQRGEGLQYDDNAGDLHIHLSPGPKVLDGDEAMQYVRFRHDSESDYGRQQRQKEFLASFKSEVLKHPFQLPEVAEQGKAALGNALNDKEMIALIAFARKVPQSSIKLGMLPTVEGRSKGGALRVVESKRDEAMRDFGLLPSDTRTAAVER